MALRIRYQHEAGGSLGYSIERLADGLFYDFSNGTFRADPTAAIAALAAGSGRFAGRYAATLDPTPPEQFPDGQYAIGIHDARRSNAQIGLLGAVMFGGDDAPAVPSGGGTTSGGGADPWGVVLPGRYGPGTAGYLLGTRLDAPVSSRSTYDGGPVASVVAPVTVGTNRDKDGYSLAPSGLDAIPVEAGVNARQALAPILAAAAGTLDGAGTGTITIRGGNVSATRIVATTDAAGNRTSVVLTLPT